MEFHEHNYKLMNGEIKLVLYDLEKEIAEVIFEEVGLEFVRLIKIFDFFDRNSELSLLNKYRQKMVSSDLFGVLKKSLKYCKLTNGAYDISLGKNILERKNGKELSPLKCSYKNIILHDKLVILNHPEVLIDLGSIAKGYIGDKISNFLLKKGVKSFFVDLRGDLIFRGKYSEMIKIQKPRENLDLPFFLKLKNCSIATSGDYKQYFQDYSKSHILNKKDLISVTVIAKNLMDADLFASLIFVLPKNKREDLIKKNKKYAVCVIDFSLNKKVYNKFESYIYHEK